MEVRLKVTVAFPPGLGCLNMATVEILEKCNSIQLIRFNLINSIHFVCIAPFTIESPQGALHGCVVKHYSIIKTE